jgi:DNA helicase-2/ATP-dependent DNA helicase PcrA
VTLSTVHSAKGLEWRSVIVIDLVEDRFPSRRSAQNPDDLEEERRLLYVACTRAKDDLTLCAPSTVFNRYNRCFESVGPSPFMLELPRDCYEEWSESYSGVLEPRAGRAAALASAGAALGRGACRPSLAIPDPTAQAEPSAPRAPSGAKPGELGACRHKIFGRGKVVALVPPDKVKVNFPGFGLKTILAEYLEMIPSGGPA